MDSSSGQLLNACAKNAVCLMVRCAAVVLVSTVLIPSAHASRFHRVHQGGGAIPLCRIDQLQLAAAWQGNHGVLLGGVTLKNTGRTSCILTGHPRVQLLNRQARPPPVQAQSGIPALMYGLGVPPGDRRAGVVRPEMRSFFSLVWANWCAGRLAKPLRLRVTLPHGMGSVTVAIADTSRSRWALMAPCGGVLSTPSLLFVGPFTDVGPGENTITDVGG